METTEQANVLGWKTETEIPLVSFRLFIIHSIIQSLSPLTPLTPGGAKLPHFSQLVFEQSKQLGTVERALSRSPPGRLPRNYGHAVTCTD